MAFLRGKVGELGSKGAFGLGTGAIGKGLGLWGEKAGGPMQLKPFEMEELQSIRSEERGEFENIMRERARGTGLMEPHKLALQRQIGDIRAAGAGQLADATSRLAQTGGASGAARERLGQSQLRQQMLQRQGARARAEEGSMQERMGLQKSLASQDVQEKQYDLGRQEQRQMLMAKMDAARQLGQAQLNAASKPDMLNRLSFGIL